jgi:hypothetical protein
VGVSVGVDSDQPAHVLTFFQEHTLFTGGEGALCAHGAGRCKAKIADINCKDVAENQTIVEMASGD